MHKEFCVESIILSEQDSIDFVNELKNPSVDYIKKRDNAFAIADSEMAIVHCDDGFMVDIPRLEISTVVEKKDFSLETEALINYKEILSALAKMARISETGQNSDFILNSVSGVNNQWNTNGIFTECKISCSRRITKKELVEGDAANLRFAA